MGERDDVHVQTRWGKEEGGRERGEERGEGITRKADIHTAYLLAPSLPAPVVGEGR